MTSIQAEYSPARTVGLGPHNGVRKTSSVLERKSTFEGKEVSEKKELRRARLFGRIFIPSSFSIQMKSPAPRSLSLAEGPPLVGKRVKEGLVSQIASRFQQQTETASSPGGGGSHPVSAPTPSKKISLDSSLGGGSSSSSSSGSKPLFRYSASESRKDDERPAHVVKRPVTRTESHHARFNNARAMFEKMGSAEELDAPSPTPAAASSMARASSVGRPSSRSSEENGSASKGPADPKGLSSGTSAYYRSRSSSPLTSSQPASAPPRTPGERPSRSSAPARPAGMSNGHGQEEATVTPANSAAPPAPPGLQNGLAETVGIVKARRLSFQQKQTSEAASAIGVAKARVNSSASVDSKISVKPTATAKVTPGAAAATTPGGGRQQRSWVPSGDSRQQ